MEYYEKNMAQYFQKLITDYSFNNEGIRFCGFSNEYNDNKTVLEKVTGRLVFKDFTLFFVYELKNRFFNTGILNCFFGFDGASLFRFSFYDIMNIADRDNFKCHTVFDISAEDELKAGFDYLCEAVEHYFNEIEGIFKDNTKRDVLADNLKTDINAFYGEDIFDKYKFYDEYLKLYMEKFYSALSLRFCCEKYILFLNGEYKAALKKYSRLNRKNRLTIYEKRLCGFIACLCEKKEGYCAYPKDLRFKRSSAEGSKSVDALITAGSLCMVYSLSCGLLFVLYNIFLRIFTCSFEYSISPSEAGIFVIALVPALILAYLNRDIFVKYILRKNTFSESINVSHYRKKINTFIGFCLIVAVILYSNSNIYFTSQGMLNNSNLFYMGQRYFDYSEIDKIRLVRYKASYRYAIILKSGDKISLSQFSSGRIEKEMIPFLGKKGIGLEIWEEQALPPLTEMRRPD